MKAIQCYEPFPFANNHQYTRFYRDMSFYLNLLATFAFLI